MNNRFVTRFVFLLVFCCHSCIQIALIHAQQQQQQSSLNLNGGSVLAMAGKDCVAIAVDQRFGSGGGPALIQVAPPPLLVASPNLTRGLYGDAIRCPILHSMMWRHNWPECLRRGWDSVAAAAAAVGERLRRWLVVSRRHHHLFLPLH